LPANIHHVFVHFIADSKGKACDYNLRHFRSIIDNSIPQSSSIVSLKEDVFRHTQ